MHAWAKPYLAPAPWSALTQPPQHWSRSNSEPGSAPGFKAGRCERTSQGQKNNILNDVSWLQPHEVASVICLCCCVFLVSGEILIAFKVTIFLCLSSSCRKLCQGLQFGSGMPLKHLHFKESIPAWHYREVVYTLVGVGVQGKVLGSKGIVGSDLLLLSVSHRRHEENEPCLPCVLPVSTAYLKQWTETSQTLSQNNSLHKLIAVCIFYNTKVFKNRQSTVPIPPGVHNLIKRYVPSAVLPTRGSPGHLLTYYPPQRVPSYWRPIYAWPWAILPAYSICTFSLLWGES